MSIDADSAITEISNPEKKLRVRQDIMTDFVLSPLSWERLKKHLNEYDVNALGAFNETILGYVVSKGPFRLAYVMTKYLIDRGAHVDKYCKYGSRPFWNATKTGNVQVMTLLWKKGADVNKITHCYSPLIFVLNCGNIKLDTITALVVTMNCRLNNVHSYHYGYTAVELAFKYHRYDIARMLLKRGARFPFHITVCRENRKAMTVRKECPVVLPLVHLVLVLIREFPDKVYIPDWFPSMLFQWNDEYERQNDERE